MPLMSYGGEFSVGDNTMHEELTKEIGARSFQEK